MAAGTIKTKAQLVTAIDSTIVGGGNISASDLNLILQDVVASYEDIIQEYTTVQRDGLTPFEGQKIYNTTSNRLEYYSATKWLPCSQKETVAVDCSANPNYQEALVGDQYTVTVAGKIGGASGKAVSVGDLVYCISDNAGGNEATVGTSWKVCYSSGAGAQIKTVSRTFTAAEVNGCFATPIALVAAVTGKTIQVLSGNYKSTYGSSDYVVTTGASIFLGADPTTYQASLDVEFSADVYKPISMTPFGGTSLKQGLAIFLYSATAISGGDSPITIQVQYIEL